jgi:uncharacterized protein (DUF488 family)
MVRARGELPAEKVTSIWTIGHSTLPAEELIEALAAEGITWLIDVRTVPKSRHNPQFNRDALPGTLAGASIAYRHEPRLGGLRKPTADSINSGWRNPGFRGYADHMQTTGFAEALDELIELSANNRIVLMCAEAVPWRCHRMLIADALTARGHDVHHILSTSKNESHRLTPFARVEDDRVTYPGLL